MGRWVQDNDPPPRSPQAWSPEYSDPSPAPTVPDPASTPSCEHCDSTLPHLHRTPWCPGWVNEGVTPMRSPADPAPTPSRDGMAELIEKAADDYFNPLGLNDETDDDIIDRYHMAEAVASALLSPANREVVLRAEREAWGHDLGGALVLHASDYFRLYRWVEPGEVSP